MIFSYPCARVASCVSFLRERFDSDDTLCGSLLLSVLYLCVLWRGETNELDGKAKFVFVSPPPDLPVVFLFLGANF